jgi:hypothetical protein
MLATVVALLGACTVKEEKTTQQPAAPTASALAPTAPAGTTTSKTYSLF